MNTRGVTLVELLVVVSIVALLVVALGFSYATWQGAYRVESEVKQLHTDLMTARTLAVQRNSRYFVDFPTPTTYRMSVDDSNGAAKVVGGDGAFQPQANPLIPAPGTDTTQPTFPKTIDYTINGGVLLTFDNQGLIYSGNPPVLIPAAPVTINLISPP